MLNELNLKAGRTYLTRGGVKTKIVEKSKDYSGYPFLSDTGRRYTAKGSYLIGTETSSDIIREIKSSDSHGEQLTKLANKILDSYTYEDLLQGTYSAIVDHLKSVSSEEYRKLINKWEI